MIAPLPKVACTSGIPIKPALKKLLEKVATPSFFPKKRVPINIATIKAIEDSKADCSKAVIVSGFFVIHIQVTTTTGITKYNNTFPKSLEP